MVTISCELLASVVVMAATLGERRCVGVYSLFPVRLLAAAVQSDAIDLSGDPTVFFSLVVGGERGVGE